jgi:AcrR family transcriptional regulator
VATSERSLTDDGTPRARLTADERREAIVSAAWTVFARNGYHRASTQEIAALAGCSEPMIYKHFTSKQALFAAVLERGSFCIKQRFAEILGHELDPDRAAETFGKDPLGTWAGVLTELVHEPMYADAARLRLFALALADDPEIRVALEGQISRQLSMAELMVARSQEVGTARTDVDPAVAAWLSASVSLVAAMRVAIEGEDGLHDMPDLIQTLVALLRPPSLDLHEQEGSSP